MSKPSAERQGRTKQPGPNPRRLSRPPCAREGAPNPFADVLCAVDGSRGSAEAVRQAIALAAPGASLSFIAVHHAVGTGLAAQAALSEQRAREALEKAALLARQAGVHASTELRAGARASDVLMAEGAKHDLLVIGCYGGSRIGGIMLGNVATRIAHRSDRPLLVARRTVDDSDFPQGILLATDGSAGSWAAARIATQVAKARRSELRVAHIPTGAHPERRREVVKQLAMIERATGDAAEVSETPGQPAERIAEAARAHLSSLIVIGRRGLKGLKALGSVSERVVHRAPCSVLVVPPEPDGG
jgi:nucleotide-binding universal stress UspA family protein